MTPTSAPTVSSLLAAWKQAHEAAKKARYQKNLALNGDLIQQAQDALTQALQLDPAQADPAWSTLPCALGDLIEFYAHQLQPARILAPRYQVEA